LVHNIPLLLALLSKPDVVPALLMQAPWMHSHWRSIIPSLETKLGLAAGTLNACHVDALWQLCTLEAGLMSTEGHLGWQQQQQQQQGRYNLSSSNSSGSSSSSSGVCGLFSQSDAMLLEWLEDVRLYETQGYGAEVSCGTLNRIHSKTSSRDVTHTVCCVREERRALLKAILIAATCASIQVWQFTSIVAGRVM
jgi:hypothetical protein